MIYLEEKRRITVANFLHLFIQVPPLTQSALISQDCQSGSVGQSSPGLSFVFVCRCLSFVVVCRLSLLIVCHLSLSVISLCLSVVVVSCLWFVVC